MIDLPGYQLVQELGRGGMARVYLALHEGLDRHVAIKLMYPNLSTDPAFSERFLREARIVARLNHPNIITIYDVNAHRGYHYIAMEYLPGDTLSDKIATGITAAHAMFLLKKLAIGLQFAHDKGFIHRDIKPENILFREDGTPVITDFGVARSERSETKMTEIGTIIGTPQYMSPEQAQGFAIKANSDFYSLGIVFYEMLIGIVPYRADSFVGIMYKHVNEPIPALPQKLQLLQPLLNKLLAKDARTRYQSADDIIKDVERIELRLPPELATTIKPAPDVKALSEKEKTRLRPETTRRRRNRSSNARMYLAAISLAAVAVGAVIVFNLPAKHPAVVATRDHGSNTITTTAQHQHAQSSAKDDTRIKDQLATQQAKNARQQAAQAKRQREANARRLAQQKAEQAQLAKQRAEKARQAREQARRERQATEKARLAKQKAEQARLAKLKAEKAREAELAREQKILQLLQNGQALLEQGKLQKAYQVYQQVLDLDKYNATAKTGLNTISDDYLTLAMKRAKADDFKRAEQYLRSAQTIAPTQPKLDTTRQQILALKNQYQNKLAETRQAASKSAQNTSKPTPQNTDTEAASQQIYGGF